MLGLCGLTARHARWLGVFGTLAWITFLECCPSDFIIFPGSTRCFMYPAVRNDFVSAEKTCRSYGKSGHIAIFDSPELGTWIIDNIIPNTTEYLWVGVNDLEVNEVYRNNNGTMANLAHQYTGAGRWTRDNTQDCLRGTRSINLQYHDTQCRYNHLFVCEMDAALYVPPSPTDVSYETYVTIGEPRVPYFWPMKTFPGLNQFDCASMCSRYGQCGAFYIHPDTSACVLLKFHNYVYTFPNGTVLHQWLLQ